MAKRHLALDMNRALMKRKARKAIPYTTTEYIQKLKRYLYFNRFYNKYFEKWANKCYFLIEILFYRQ